ncbi:MULTISPECIES: TonB-dependent receptor [unclassified Sphingomonas]|uniref:TonB-dependent receptor n=1 Tax=unclassified Sphingomonas TaxID=196159 RepID=UPI0008361C11|nr:MULTISPECIES: TonB-dependent receptor [unclassified Sphingomonas]
MAIRQLHFARRSSSGLALALSLLAAGPAWSQQAPADGQSDAESEEVVVTGFRASLANALSDKRKADQIVDSITAEDIADFPDANIAESIQRLPGISIDRDNGEGRSITVRGLGGDFQSVFLNGADAQNISGGNQSDAGGNRSRGFDFNTFASELFSGVKITKSVTAKDEEGSLGAIIDLITGRPLAYKGDRIAIGAEGEYRENGDSWNPRLTGLFSKRLADNFGILGTVAFQDQRQQIDSYRRQPGQFEYAYRNSQHTGVTPNVFGFARPTGTGTGATFGSDPTAYALVTPTTIIPALPQIGRQDLQYDRLGVTFTAQWQPTSRTEVIADFVYSRYRQDSNSQGITPIGLNRNGTNARVAQNTLRALNTANGLADRRALYARCDASASLDCGQALYGNTLVAGTRASYNPFNLDPFDYYNSTVSPGYIANANSIAYYDELLGRPGTQIRAANVNAAGQADYLVLDNVDWRSFADAQFGQTNFKQATLNVNHEFSDSFRVALTGGWSKSEFDATGLLVEFNSIDRDGYVFDERGGGRMPVFNPGFNVADPTQWTLVKGLSVVRYFTNEVNNEFRVGRANFEWDLSEQFTLRFGGTYKTFEFDSLTGRRNQGIEAINPTLQEAGLQITQLGQLVGFGQGLNVTAGTPTSFYAPDLDAFRRYFSVDCNCINKWGDYRAQVDGRERNAVKERDLAGFVQMDFDVDVMNRRLRGNVGVRVANTRVDGTGSVGGAANGVVGTIVTARNEYTDVLPAGNLTWEVADNFQIRAAAAKTMSRPQLAALTPGTTSFPTGLTLGGSAPSITVGNPYLSPFRSTNLDLSFEYYWGTNGFLGLALFQKDISSFPQQVAGEFPLQAIYPQEIIDQIIPNITSATLAQYIRDGGVFAVRQFDDAPGGKIQGVEVNVQTNFFFLPGFLQRFGVTANYTYIKSELNYLTGTTLSTVQGQTTSTAVNEFATGPFLNTSPHSFNATLYYEDGPLKARVSGAYRKEYVNRFPLSSGTCSVGTTTNAGGPCNSPVVADFGYNEDTFNLDFSMSYALTREIRLSLEGRNLTNATQYRTMYQANPVSSSYASTGRIVTVGVRAVF